MNLHIKIYYFFVDDILVLTFTKRVKFNAFIRPACLWDRDTPLDKIVGSYGTVSVDQYD